MTVLYLSPHLDDAVLSAGVSIQRDVHAGLRVVVATVFSEGRDAPRRKQEDRAALARLGAEPTHLGLHDFPERRGTRPSFHTLCVAVDRAREREEARAVRRHLRALCERFDPRRVHLPLGVGGHVDHRLVCAAGAHLPRERVRYYEDLPYALARGLLAHRLGERLRGARRWHLRAALLGELAAFGATDADLTALLRRPRSREAPAVRVAARLTATGAEQRARIDAIVAYASQLRWIAGRRCSTEAARARVALALGGLAEATGTDERVWERRPLLP